MLGKLIKHEFRATGRLMAPLFGAMLLLAVFVRVSDLILSAADVPVILLECDALDAPQAGELLYFFELANAICAAASGVDPLAPMQFGPARTLAGKLLGKLE